MPELPEVEVVRKFLNAQIIEKKIYKISVVNEKLRYNIPTSLNKKLSGLIITKILRRGKYLILLFNHNYSLLIHLGMTGYFRISNSDKTIKHDHLIFYFKENKLIFNDIRKFGFIKLFNSVDIFNSSHLQKIGVDPFSKKFNYKFFKKNLRKSLDVKTLLMNQSFIAGLGNIYCSEILFDAKINPLRKSETLTSAEVKKIIKSTIKILARAINFGGTKIKNFIVSDEKIGYFKNELKVYSRNGLLCTRCKKENFVIKIKQKGRSTFLCNKCQI